MEDFELGEGGDEVVPTFHPMEDLEAREGELPRLMTPLPGLPEEDSLMTPLPGLPEDDEMPAMEMPATEMQVDEAPSATQDTSNRNGNGRRKMSIQEEDEARWAVASTFFEHRSLVENQLQSFNDFLEDGIHEMFRQVAPIEIMPDQNPTSVRTNGYPRQARFWYGDLTVGKPNIFVDESKKETRVLFPREARLRNMTYSAPLYLKIHLEVQKANLYLWSL